jgi:hypothetical protein
VCVRVCVCGALEPMHSSAHMLAAVNDDHDDNAMPLVAMVTLHELSRSLRPCMLCPSLVGLHIDVYVCVL